MSLNLTSSHSEGTLKQLKSMTSPLSMIAKGVQSIGLNLGSHKVGLVSKRLS